MVNEFLQWAAIASVFLLVLAMYRQHGAILIGSRGMVEQAIGPPEGAAGGRELAQLFHFDEPAPPGRRYQVHFVRESCPLCEEVLRDLERASATGPLNMPSDPVHYAVVVVGSADFVVGLNDRIANVVIEEFPRVYRRQPSPQGFPLTVELDEHFTVSKKYVGLPERVVHR